MKAPAAVGPYSQAVEMNDILFVSGQVPLDPETGTIVEGGISEQTRQALQNIGRILEAAGYGFEARGKIDLPAFRYGKLQGNERGVCKLLS